MRNSRWQKQVIFNLQLYGKRGDGMSGGGGGGSYTPQGSLEIVKKIDEKSDNVQEFSVVVISNPFKDCSM